MGTFKGYSLLISPRSSKTLLMFSSFNPDKCPGLDWGHLTPCCFHCPSQDWRQASIIYYVWQPSFPKYKCRMPIPNRSIFARTPTPASHPYQSGHWITPQWKALKSRGTLLPRPARYFFGPPWKSLGFGNMDSSWNFHLGSFITNLLDGSEFLWGLGFLGKPPFEDRV